MDHLRSASANDELRPRGRRAPGCGGPLSSSGLLIALLVLLPPVWGADAPDPFAAELRPLLERYCFDCHARGRIRGGLDLRGFEAAAGIVESPELWEKVALAVRERLMPPARREQPPEEERRRLWAGILALIDEAEAGAVPIDPGRPLIRRLSRSEYDNTVRDLLGAGIRPAERFPADGSGGGGFDNNADTLFVPPILLERYLEAAAEVVEAADPAELFVARPSAELEAAAAARQLLAHHLPRAFRRPVEESDLEPYLELYTAARAEGRSFEEAVKLALRAVLVSPRFLFRIELERAGEGPQPLDDHELATRLSYFLWASMPDAELFRLADAGRLREPEVLEAQVARMLRDPRAEAFAEAFVSQWLGTSTLRTTAQPDSRRFPWYGPALAEALHREPVAFFLGLLKESGSLLDLLDAGYAYLNEELAEHYGIAGVEGQDFRRVELPSRERGGVLGMGAVHLITSYPRRTSPVLRGKWILEEILGTPAPPPPQNIKLLPPDDAPREGLTFRQRLEEHRKNPECTSCHQRMDPLGFALENFDVTGRWREEIGGVPVDASGALPGGESFAGPAELKRVLRERRDLFVKNLAERLLAYALGRGLERCDRPSVRRIVAALEAGDYRAPALILEIVKSFPFQYRRNPSLKEASDDGP
jgi:hypothetical protein